MFYTILKSLTISLICLLVSYKPISRSEIEFIYVVSTNLVYKYKPNLKITVSNDNFSLSHDSVEFILISFW